MLYICGPHITREEESHEVLCWNCGGRYLRPLTAEASRAPGGWVLPATCTNCNSVFDLCWECGTAVNVHEDRAPKECPARFDLQKEAPENEEIDNAPIEGATEDDGGILPTHLLTTEDGLDIPVVLDIRGKTVTAVPIVNGRRCRYMGTKGRPIRPIVRANDDKA